MRRARMGAACAPSMMATMTAIACGGASHAPTSAPSTTSGAASDPTAIARIHKSRCGACHVRVEPGARTRAQLDDAFTRHRKRVHLSEAEWAQMIDYLASP